MNTKKERHDPSHLPHVSSSKKKQQKNLQHKLNETKTNNFWLERLKT